MTVGLLAPLSPQEEIALRRVALGSFVVDAQAASRLIGMALLQRTSSGLRLTPLGQRHFNALPKAPLLAHQRSIHAITGYVEGLIEKAQSRAAARRLPSERAGRRQVCFQRRQATKRSRTNSRSTSIADIGSHVPTAPWRERDEPSWSIANGRSGYAMPAIAGSHPRERC